MVSSAARTVEEYLASLPEERRQVVTTIRDTVRKHLPDGYAEGMNYGMICYHIPLERYPGTYNGQPLCYASLAAQKNHYSLYLLGAYSGEGPGKRLKEGFARAGKKLDMGKSCVRFKRTEDLPLDVIGECIASVSPAQFIAVYEKAQSQTKTRKKSAAKKSSTR
jgi:hypothetical protein